MRFSDILFSKLAALFLHKRYTFSAVFVAGSLAALSMAPYNIWFVLLLSLPVLYLSILHAPSSKIAGLYGWLFGFGYFVFSLSWIGNALLVEGNPYKWAWILSVTGLPAILALFPACACLVSKHFMNMRSFWGWIGFISLYSLFEWLRGHLFTGFPWNLIGYTWAEHLAVIQVLRISDVYFLSWLSLLWLSLPVALAFTTPQQRITALCVAALSFTLCFGFGLTHLKTEQDNNTNVSIKLVQPNIEQSQKWKRDKMSEHLAKHLSLSESAGNEQKPTLIIWPETALSFRMFESPETIKNIKSMLSSYPLPAKLLTGMLRHDPVEGTYSNSLIMIDETGTLQNIYNKHHLVPFGEYIPFQKWIPLAPVVQFKGFEAGQGLQTFSAFPNVHYSPLICYEIIFPGRSIGKPSSPMPDFIVNATNDAWYGKSAGPHQHFVKTLYRAIETGVPVIRSANTGFSAIISPTGEAQGKSALFQESSKSLDLPLAKPIHSMVFNNKNVVVVLFLMFFTILGIGFGRRITNCD